MLASTAVDEVFNELTMVDSLQKKSQQCYS